jgi:hypothetical protein
MKTKLALIALAAFGGFTAFANSAAAHPEIHVGIGFNSPPPAYYPLAPVFVGNSERDYRSGGYDRDYRPGNFDRDYRGGNYDCNYRPAGCWREITVKTWVPSCIWMSRDWCGRPVQVVEPGHFAYRTERVWVSNRG